MACAGLPRDDSKVTFNWWREDDNTYLSTATDHRKLFGSKSKFSGFIQISNVRFQDAGIYYCAVQQHGYTIGSQVGSNLTVWVPPTAVKIRPRESPRGSSLSLVCEASAFYPDIIAFEWYKDGIDISTKMSVEKQRNSDGLYQARSFWEEKQAAASGSVYSCLVSHITLEDPLAVTHVITYSNAGSQSFRLLMIFGCIGCGLICLLFTVLIWKRHQLKDL
ncbi:H-2 class II histocompatibility antigen, I-A beta chain-like isoform X2 [Scyliorhinus canicula]|uniref:H-2 class II histocompatibility antigen, I-A beta chain-like isoform X2 n=1 Tax=Scyliorhinus canicula TaxID=7830 RepID=UPI0018F47569|nr:H-2 class II histocompatibility antigen, I-A beta chain-like isoform X2 [Scyliorhinus canicula]